MIVTYSQDIYWTKYLFAYIYLLPLILNFVLFDDNRPFIIEEKRLAPLSYLENKTLKYEKNVMHIHCV